MNRLSSEVKILDFATTIQRNRDIITAISLRNTNPGIPVLVLGKCNVRPIFRQFKGPLLKLGGPTDLTTLFDKIEFFYLALAGPPGRDHNYSRSIFGECGKVRGSRTDPFNAAIK